MLRDALRSRTRIEHERLERRLEIERYLEDRLDYVELLKRFYGFYAPLEKRLSVFAAAFEARGIDLAARSKTERLVRDLQVFGQPCEPRDWSHVLPDVATFPRAVGCLYVAEGSTLGGQIIIRRVRESLGIDEHTGGAFFSGYGSETGSMWQAFLRFLGALEFDARETEQAISAARETFECIEQWMCEAVVADRD